MVGQASSIRQFNRRAIVRALVPHRLPASRADLAKMVGMSQVTAGKIVDELLDGRRRRRGRGRPDPLGEAARLGRPGRMLQLNISRKPLLGRPLGTFHTRLARVPSACSPGPVASGVRYPRDSRGVEDAGSPPAGELLDDEVLAVAPIASPASSMNAAAGCCLLAESALAGNREPARDRWQSHRQRRDAAAGDPGPGLWPACRSSSQSTAAQRRFLLADFGDGLGGGRRRREGLRGPPPSTASWVTRR